MEGHIGEIQLYGHHAAQPSQVRTREHACFNSGPDLTRLRDGVVLPHTSAARKAMISWIPINERL